MSKLILRFAPGQKPEFDIGDLVEFLARLRNDDRVVKLALNPTNSESFSKWLSEVASEKYKLLDGIVGHDWNKWREHIFLAAVFLSWNEKETAETVNAKLVKIDKLAKGAFGGENVAKFVAELEESKSELLSVYDDEDGLENEIAWWSRPLGDLPPTDPTSPPPGTMREVLLPGDVPMTFCWCPATTSEDWKRISGGRDYFMMGSPESERERCLDEDLHGVKITKGFWLAQTPVTIRQYEAVMDNDQSMSENCDIPIVNVDMRQIKLFCRKLKERTRGMTFELPSEAQWEYACRAGTTTKRYAEPQSKIASHDRKRVMSKMRNDWNFYDMLGNVWEFCADFYRESLGDEIMCDPLIKRGGCHVVRGGSYSHSRSCRSAFRGQSEVAEDVGFRPIMIEDDGGYVAELEIGQGLNQPKIEEKKVMKGKVAHKTSSRSRTSSRIKESKSKDKRLKSGCVRNPRPRKINLSSSRITNPQRRKMEESFSYEARTVRGGECAPRKTKVHNTPSRKKKSSSCIAIKKGTVTPKVAGLTNPPGTTYEIHLPGDVPMTFCWCPATTSEDWKWISGGDDFFRMGSHEFEEAHCDDETRHCVWLTKGFWIGQFEVTQRQWKIVMGNNPSLNKAGDLWPVENVSWDDCQKFIARINAEWKYHVSLPTEAQWEYACRAGTQTPFSFGSALNGNWANCNGDYPYGTSVKGEVLGHTTLVGSYEPNAWNIYDMHGNIWEWCEDCYDSDFYTKKAGKVNPCCTSGDCRVRRGGSWNDGAVRCRSAFRNFDEPRYPFFYTGFRLCMSAEECVNPNVRVCTAGNTMSTSVASVCEVDRAVSERISGEDLAVLNELFAQWKQ